MTKNEKFINRNSKNQKKKIENFWDQKFRVRHARYRISTPGTRCTRLEIFLKNGYIYNRFCVPKFGEVWGGGSICPPSHPAWGGGQIDPPKIYV